MFFQSWKKRTASLINLHVLRANIPGNALEKGETIVEYMPPFPPKGTGYHRHIFLLYKQNKRLDFSGYRKEGPCRSLPERTFSTFDFYRGFQEEITPAGLAFFQSDWSMFVRQFFHGVLGGFPISCPITLHWLFLQT